MRTFVRCTWACCPDLVWPQCVSCSVRSVPGDVSKTLIRVTEEPGVTLLILGVTDQSLKRCGSRMRAARQVVLAHLSGFSYVYPALHSARAEAILLVRPPLPKYDDKQKVSSRARLVGGAFQNTTRSSCARSSGCACNRSPIPQREPLKRCLRRRQRRQALPPERKQRPPQRHLKETRCAPRILRVIGTSPDVKECKRGFNVRAAARLPLMEAAAVERISTRPMLVTACSQTQVSVSVGSPPALVTPLFS